MTQVNTRHLRWIGAVLMLAALGNGRAAGQRLAPAFQSTSTDAPRSGSVRSPVAPPASVGGSSVLAAAGLGLLGWGVGALAGNAIAGDCGVEFCRFEGIFYGGAAGGGLGLALGAHLGNHRRGSFPLDLLASGVVWALGYGAMAYSVAQDNDMGRVITAIVLPPVQLLVTVIIEGATSPPSAPAEKAP
jgi:hypothetical protein